MTTCKERISDRYEGRIKDLRLLYDMDVCYGLDKCELEALVDIIDVTFGYTPEPDFDAILECLYNARAEYGLCWDYVEPDTFNEHAEIPEGYYRYQLSCGGPQDEFRFYPGYMNTRKGWHLSKITYNFLDWFDGAEMTPQGDDWKMLETIYQDFVDCGMCETHKEDI